MKWPFFAWFGILGDLVFLILFFVCIYCLRFFELRLKLLPKRFILCVRKRLHGLPDNLFTFFFYFSGFFLAFVIFLDWILFFESSRVFKIIFLSPQFFTRFGVLVFVERRFFIVSGFDALFLTVSFILFFLILLNWWLNGKIFQIIMELWVF